MLFKISFENSDTLICTQGLLEDVFRDSSLCSAKSKTAGLTLGSWNSFAVIQKSCSHGHRPSASVGHSHKCDIPWTGWLRIFI